MKWLTPQEFRAALFLAVALLAGSVVNHVADLGVQTAKYSAETPPEDLYSIFPIDINRAGLKELILLPAIGETKARAILAHRADKGPYESLQELLEVRGIGPKTLEKLKELVTVVAVETSGDSLGPLEVD
jgi:competence protein ComEA